MGILLAEGTAEDWKSLKREIVVAAPSLGIDKIGFASADPFLALKDILRRRREQGKESGFEEPDIDKRVHPEIWFREPRSIISIAVAYPSKLPNPPKSEPGARRGVLSRSAWGEDYHHVLRRRLQSLETFIRERVPDARMESMVDTGVLVDRAVAERAGVGWSGKNCSIITPEFGSWVYLGEMVTNIPFEPDEPITDQCGDCTLCIDACPTGALEGPGDLNARKCISFLTQTKDIVPDEYKRKIGNRLYGCDTCQVVCPKNRGKNWTRHPELAPDPELAKPLLVPLLEMSNRRFREVFGGSAAAWRGKKPLQRNAVIALGHFREAGAVPKLRDILLSDPRRELREAAAWALGRIGGGEALAALRQAHSVETDPEVADAIERAVKAVQERDETLQ